jgi:hypothetical protein
MRKRNYAVQSNSGDIRKRFQPVLAEKAGENIFG